MGTDGCRRHSTKATMRFSDYPMIDTQFEGSGKRRNILVEPFGQFVREKDFIGLQERNFNFLQKFTRKQRRFAVGREERRCGYGPLALS